jgi:serine/threonine protein kinase
MAPERLSGVAAPSNDIYSLGVILHQMLTGKLPSKDHPASLPQPLEYVINRCLASQLSDRFATAEDLLNAFEYAYQYLKSAPQQSAAPATSSVQLPPQPVAGQSVAPVLPNRANTPGTGTPSMSGMVGTPGTARPTRSINPEIKILPRSEDIPHAPIPVQPVIPVQAAIPGQHAPVFGQADYESPTVDIDPSLLATQGKRVSSPSLPAVSPPVKRPKPKKRRRNPLLAILTLLIVFILLAMAVLFFFELSPALAVTANVNFGPKVQVVKQVFRIKGSGSKSSVDANTSTIPIKAVNNTQNGSLAGQTSQQCVIPPIFGCQQVVTQDDVDRLSAQLRQTLDKQIRQNLQQQMQSKGGTPVGTVQVTDAPATAKPQVGTPSKTVTVTINGQSGQGAYYSNSDARTLARLLLTQQVQQLGANYVLINSSVQIGQSAYEGVDNNGQVLIAIAAAGVAQYQFPSSELVTIQNGLKSMKQTAAIAYVKQQAGVDPASVSIRVSSGDTLPSDVQRIKIITINPTTFPTITLPQVTPVASPTASQ